MIRPFTRQRISAATFGLAILVSPFRTTAATCDETFDAIGDPRNGLAFLAERKVSGLPIASALGQARQYGLDEGFVIGTDTMSGKTGQLYLMQESSKPPIVMTFTASPGGLVELGTKLPRGQKMQVEDAKKLMCGLLNRLKAGKEGESIAAEARRKSDANRITETTAVDLSTTLGKETKKLSRAMNAGSFKDIFFGTHTSPDKLRDRDAMFSPLLVKYIGRKYRIDGEVYTASINPYSGTGQVAWLVTKTYGILRVQADDDLNNGQFTVICAMAQDQNPLVATLRSHDFVKLEGTVDSIDLSGVHLKDCRQAK